MNPELLKSQFATLEEPEAAEGVIAIELGGIRASWWTDQEKAAL
jgi:gluconate kinase